MNEQKHIIWSSDVDYEDWRADLEEQYPDLSEQERMELMVEQNNDYLDDERCNLNIQLSRPILLIADIGRWDGRYPGYAEIKSGNIRDCLYSEMDDSTWYPYVTAEEFLSGNVRKKLRMLQALQAALPAEKKDALAGYLSAMEAVQPTELTAAEIGVRIGASWVPTDVYQQFMARGKVDKKKSPS